MIAHAYPFAAGERQIGRDAISGRQRRYGRLHVIFQPYGVGIDGIAQAIHAQVQRGEGDQGCMGPTHMTQAQRHQARGHDD